VSLNIGERVRTTVAVPPPPFLEPVYRLDRTWEQNAAEGPFFTGPYADVPSTPAKVFFGHQVASRIGMAASLLMNERWFELYSRLGFDLLTYKTVRSRARIAHPVPNWLFMDDAMDLARCHATTLLPAARALPCSPVDAT